MSFRVGTEVFQLRPNQRISTLLKVAQLTGASFTVSPDTKSTATAAVAATAVAATAGGAGDGSDDRTEATAAVAATAGGAGDGTDDRTDDRTGDNDGDGDDADDDEDDDYDRDVQVILCRKETLGFYRGESFGDVKRWLIENWGLDCDTTEMRFCRDEVFRRMYEVDEWETVEDYEDQTVFVEWASAGEWSVSRNGAGAGDRNGIGSPQELSIGLNFTRSTIDAGREVPLSDNEWQRVVEWWNGWWGDRMTAEVWRNVSDFLTVLDMEEETEDDTEDDGAGTVSVELTVVPPTGETFTIAIRSDATVASLKHVIAWKINMPQTDIVIRSADRDLESAKHLTVSAVGLGDLNRVEVVLGVRGGNGTKKKQTKQTKKATKVIPLAI